VGEREVADLDEPVVGALDERVVEGFSDRVVEGLGFGFFWFVETDGTGSARGVLCLDLVSASLIACTAATLRPAALLRKNPARSKDHSGLETTRNALILLGA
jgi:hypothetical protein